MIIEKPIYRRGSEILPKGDRYDLPPGRRQFSLLSLFWLLTLGAVAAAICRWLGATNEMLVLVEIYVVVLWWAVAERREAVESKPPADQTALWEEVRKWLPERQRNGR